MGEILTADELAARLKVRPATIRGWGRDGRIPTVRITPKVIRYDADAVMLSLSSAKPASGGEAKK